jgi:hypothetical protein
VIELREVGANRELVGMEGEVGEVASRMAMLVDLVGGKRESTNPAHSLGAKRLTPAATQASMRVFWLVLSMSVCERMKERTVCTPVRILVRWALSW